MKKSIFIIIIIIISIKFIFSSNVDEDDCDCGPKEILNGKIKDIKTTEYTYTNGKNEFINYQASVKYDNNGNLIERIDYKPYDNTHIYYQYYYNKNKKLIEIITLDDNKEILNSQKWKYDNQNNIIENITSGKYGFAHNIFYFNNKNILIKKKQLDKEKKIIKAIKYVYDKSNLINEITFSSNGEIIEKKIIIYDNNNVIEKNTYSLKYYDKLTLIQRTTYKYNDQNKIIELINENKIYGYELEITDKTNWIYDKSGNLVEKNYTEPKNNVISKTLVNYNDLYKVISKKYYYNNELIRYILYNESGKEKEYYYSGKGKYIYVYDKNDLLIEHYVYDINNNLIFQEQYTYNEKGQNILSIGNDNNSLSKTIRKFDKNENMILEENYSEDILRRKLEIIINYYE